MKIVNLNYIRCLHRFILDKTDEELDDFFINDEDAKEAIYRNARMEFAKFGPKSKKEVLSALEYIFSLQDIGDYWRFVIPHDVPLDEVVDKRNFLRGFFYALSDRHPKQLSDWKEVGLVDEIGPSGLDITI